MSVNSTNTFFADVHNCFKSTPGRHFITAFTVAAIVFFLPVYAFILRLGFQQWRRQSFSTAAMSHFDLFTYNLVLYELLKVLGCICLSCGAHTNRDQLLFVGNIFDFVSGFGQLFFHTLTCAERHLAVVYPVTYRSLKGEKWNRVRNGIIAFIWLLSLLLINLIFIQNRYGPFLSFLITTVVLMFLILGFSLSVLRVLIRAGPGDRSEGRQHVDQSKLRAFYVILAVLAVLVLKLTWDITVDSLLISASESVSCGFCTFTQWISVPCSLLIPLLYLQRKKKLLCCTKKENKGKRSLS